eukprot:GFUD01114742.1.p1 GENE.GFUD01114742.1~~GFUD01114742.1.p1  ORF type:complete len:187 (+),score=13.19 GFUD01114742.1:110-670(+)
MSLAEKVISNNIDAARTSRMVIDEDPGLDGERGKVDRPNSWVKLYAPEEPVPVIRVERGLVSHVEGESLEGEDCDMAKHGTAGAFESIDKYLSGNEIIDEYLNGKETIGLSVAGHGAGVDRLPHEGGLHEDLTVDAGADPPQGPWTTRSSSTGPAMDSPEKYLVTSRLVRDWVGLGRLHYEVASAT